MSHEFHIHVDAAWLAPEFEHFLMKELRFWRMDFCHDDSAGDTYAPTVHITKKFFCKESFEAAYARIEEIISRRKVMEGYIEGEFLPLDINLVEKPFNPLECLPFVLEMAPLAPGAFRESEIHITMAKEQSDARLRENLRKIGFLMASLEKKYGMAEVFTAQASIEVIARILPSILHYLDCAGGAVACSVKEERVVRAWTSGPDVRLAPVVGRIIFPGTS